MPGAASPYTAKPALSGPRSPMAASMVARCAPSSATMPLSLANNPTIPQMACHVPVDRNRRFRESLELRAIPADPEDHAKRPVWPHLERPHLHLLRQLLPLGTRRRVGVGAAQFLQLRIARPAVPRLVAV